jgi:hypothetical protein
MSGKKKRKDSGSILFGKATKEETDLAEVVKNELGKRGIECEDWTVDTKLIGPENDLTAARVFSLVARPMVIMPIEVAVNTVRHTMGGPSAYADLIERALLRDLEKMIKKSTLNPEKAFKRERRVAEASEALEQPEL